MQGLLWTLDLAIFLFGEYADVNDNQHPYASVYVHVWDHILG